jgi:hypothetical protein
MLKTIGMDAGAEQSIQQKYQLLGELFNERERRLWAAVEARQLPVALATVETPPRPKVNSGRTLRG